MKLVRRFALMLTFLPVFNHICMGSALADDTLPATEYFAAYGNHGGVIVSIAENGEERSNLSISFGDTSYAENYDIDLKTGLLVKKIVRGGIVDVSVKSSFGEPEYLNLLSRARDLLIYTVAPERYLWTPYFGKNVLNVGLSAVVEQLGAILAHAGRNLKACEFFEEASFSGNSVQSDGGLSTGDLRLFNQHARAVWVRDGYKLVLLDKPSYATDGTVLTLDPLTDPGIRKDSGVSYDLAKFGFDDKTVSFVCMKKL